MLGEGLLGSACLLVLPQGLPESPHPPRAWAPVGAAGEAGAEHLPVGRTPGSCPILFLLLVPVLWESRMEATGPIPVCGGPGRWGSRDIPRPRLGEGSAWGPQEAVPAQPTTAPKSQF